MDETKNQRPVEIFYRTVDIPGQIAKRRCCRCIRFLSQGHSTLYDPEVVTIDKSGANTAVLTTFNAEKPEEETITVRQNKYLNKLIELDH